MHHGDGTLRAFLDGELDTPLTHEIARHLKTCAICRARLDDVNAHGRATDRLIGLVAAARRPRRPYVPVLAAASVVLAFVFARQVPSTHPRLAGGAHVQDVCCFNLDGGGRGDDGMLTISRPGQVVDCVVLYEDQAGTRAFSPRDPVRFVSRPAGCDISGS
jgi:hypothetical protein